MVAGIIDVEPYKYVKNIIILFRNLINRMIITLNCEMSIEKTIFCYFK